MRRAALAWLIRAGIVAACLASCDKGPSGGAKKIPRDSDSQAVVVVEARPTTSVSMADEIEPNDTADQAMELTSGSGVRGTLNGETDVDLYRVRVAEPGFLDARVDGIEGVDLVLELRSGDKVLATSDRGPALVTEGIAGYRVERGEYLVAVREFVKKPPSKRRKPKKGQAPEPEPAGRQGPSPVYELVVQVRAAAERNHEIEPNDSMEQAGEILIGDELQGFLGWAHDVDMWKISVEGFTDHYGLDIDVSGVPEVNLQLTLLDDGRKVLAERQGRKGEGVSLRNLVVSSDDAAGAGTSARPAGSPRHYYVKLDAKRSNPVDPYRIRVTTRLLEIDDETEPNDTVSTARPLRESADVTRGTRRGTLTAGDVDHYQLDAAAPAFLWVQVKPAGDLDVALEVLVGGQPVAMANSRKGRGEEFLADVRVPAGKAAVIKVSGAGPPGTDPAYELSWALEPQTGAPLEQGRDLDLLDEYETP